MNKKQFFICLSCIISVIIFIIVISYISFNTSTIMWTFIASIIFNIIELLTLLVFLELLMIEKSHTRAMSKSWTDAMGRELTLKDNIRTKLNKIQKLKKELSDLKKGKIKQ